MRNWIVRFAVVLASAMAIGSFSNRFARVEFPNGSFARSAHPFADGSTWKWGFLFYRADGKLLVESRTEFYCYNDDYVIGYGDRNFIYRRGDAVAVYADQPIYDTLIKESSLRKLNGSCQGETESMAGPTLIMDTHPHRRRQFWQPLAPFIPREEGER